MSFLKGFLSLFDWMFVDASQSPEERVDEILNNFYLDHYPYIERDDLKALEKDSLKAWQNYRI